MVTTTLTNARPVAENDRSEVITTSDGVALRVSDRGTGPVLVLLPGWSQSAAEFQKQIDHFSRTRRVIAIDHRGHGRSGKPDAGYRMTRLAADLRDVFTAKGLVEVDLLAHSMGCVVVWAYWNLFGGSRIRSLVLVDQPAALTASPLDDVDVTAQIGAPLVPAAVGAFVAALAGPGGEAVTRQAVASMFTPSIDPTDLEWIVQQNLLTPRGIAAALFYNEALADLRDVLPSITVPTLVTGGELSLHPVSGPIFVADQIPGSRRRIFTAEERGSHFVFWENPDLFNPVVDHFLDEVSPTTPRS